MEWAYSEYTEIVSALYSCVSDSILSGILFGTLITMLLHLYKITAVLKKVKRKPLSQRVRLMHPHLLSQDKLDESMRDEGGEAKEQQSRLTRVPHEVQRDLDRQFI